MEKSCTIYNGQFSWIMEVDGKIVHFDGMENAEYFSDHYFELGYIVNFNPDPPKPKL